MILGYNPPTSKASREVSNWTEIKTLTHVYGVKEFITLSVCRHFDYNYLRTGKIEQADMFKKKIIICLLYPTCTNKNARPNKNQL